MEVAEEQKEDDVEEPVGVDEETVGHEEDVEVVAYLLRFGPQMTMIPFQR